MSNMESTTSLEGTSPVNDSVETSELFNDPNADITFMSSDGVLFKIYSKHLETTSAGLSVPASTVVDDQPVVLTEPAKVLEVVFQFIHPRSEAEHYRQPSVMDMEPSLFFAVAEAAEKYLLFGAMNTCITRMQLSMHTSHPFEVLNHCAKHGYNDLADKAAPETISVPNTVEAALNALNHPGVSLKWFKYYSHWVQITKFAERLLSQSPFVAKCYRISISMLAFLRNVAVNPRNTTLGKIELGHHCTGGSECHCLTGNWQNLIDEQVAAIPKFSQIS